MKKTLILSITAVFSSILFFSCKNGKVANINRIKSLSIQSSPQSKTDPIELQIGSKENISLIVLFDPENVTNKKVTWSSNKPGVVSVDASGLVKALSPGMATVKVVSEDGNKSAEIAINVAQRKPKTLTIDKPATTIIYIGESTLDLNATFKGFSTNEVEKWTSSDESIAKVNIDTGVVTGVAPGYVVIRVESVGNPSSFYHTIQIEVKIRPKIEITNRPQTTTLLTSLTLKLEAKITGLSGGQGAKWTSSSEIVATVGQTTGLVQPKKAGAVTITVTSIENPNIKDSIELIVKYPSSIEIVKVPLTYVNNQQYVLAIGEKNRNLIASTKPVTSVAKWSSSDENIATIDEDSGIITALAKGDVIFTATLSDNSSIKDTVKMLVYSKSSNSVVVVGVNNHVYQFSNKSISWDDAKKDASNVNGHLLEISDENEQNLIQSILDNATVSNALSNSNNNPDSTIAIDGGGSRYIWIGANDKTTEGTWEWALTPPIRIGQGTNVSWTDAPGVYSNWGKNGTNGKQKEPDNYQNTQDSAAIALEVWPKGASAENALGQKHQWNDLNPSDNLWYIIEIDLQ